MRHLSTILAVAVMVMASLACQEQTCRVVGTVDGLEDGDTIILTSDLAANTPQKKAVVKNGAFQIECSSTDSVGLHVLYVGNRPDLNVSFFPEPAEIMVHLSTDMAKCSVSGTKANDAWNHMNQQTAHYSGQMREQLQKVYDQSLSEDERIAVMESINGIEQKLVAMVVETAEQNIDNELGFFIVTHFEEDNLFPASKRLALLDKMPGSFRSRPAAQELHKALQQAQMAETGNTMPDFELPDATGRSTSAMSIVKDAKITIIDFWASWCGPCRQEMPSLVSLYDDYHAKGLNIIGVSLDENRDAWTAAVKQMGMTWTQLSDLKGWNSSAAQLFQVKAIPQTVVVDAQGTILGKGLRGTQLRQIVSQHLDE